MELKEAKKIYNQISTDDAMTVLAYYDFNTNLGNFRLSETEVEMVWDFTNIIMEKNTDLSEAYNFDTVSYALMGYLEENPMEDLINNLFPTPEAKLFNSPDYDFIREIGYTYNDLETKYEI